MKISRWALFLALMALIGLTACGSGGNGGGGGSPDNGGNSATSVNKNQEPFTLRIVYSGGGTDEQRDAQYKTPEFMAKYPNATLEYIPIAKLEESVAAGVIPDLLNVTPSNMYRVQDLGLARDMSDLAKKNNLDLSKFDQSALAGIKQAGGKGGLIAIPDKPPGFPYLATFGLVYNKDLFDKFAVPYPKDNMTWSEVIELSKRLYRTDGGVQYYGLSLINAPNAMINQRGLSFLDKDGKAELSDPQWTEILQILKTASEAQGNWDNMMTNNFDAFQKDKIAAMAIGPIAAIVRGAEALEGKLNWDMATIPRFADQPKTVVPYSAGVSMVTSQSKHPDAAFDQVLISIYAKDTNKAAFENPAAMKRNMDAIRNHPIGLAPSNKYSTDFYNTLNQAVRNMVQNNTDINTVLRTVQEQTQKNIDDKK